MSWYLPRHVIYSHHMLNVISLISINLYLYGLHSYCITHQIQWESIQKCIYIYTRLVNHRFTANSK